MGYRFSKGWNSKDNSWSTGGEAGSGCDASGTKSYHNGGVEGSSFAKWYDKHLAEKFDGNDDGKGFGSGGTKGSGSGGTKGSGSGGTKGSGSGGTKGSGSGGTKGSGSGGTKGSGSGGTKGSGSGGTKGSGSGGTKGSGSGGTKGSGSGGTKGSGSGGTKGSGSGGTKGSGSGGTKGSGSGGTKGSGSGGMKGSGSGGTKGSGSGGTKGSGSGGTKGSGSGGTKGSGSGGTKGSGSGGTKGSGSGGTKGSGSGGTKGSGSGGTKGSGSGGTKGSGSGGTKGSGSCGTKGSGSGGTQGGHTGGDDKSVLNFLMGESGEITIAVTETPEGQLHFNLSPTDPEAESHADINGLFFNVTDGSAIEELNFFPDVNAEGYHLTDVKAADDGVDGFDDGPQAGGSFDVGLQFGTTADSSDGEVPSTNFTLWTYPGSLSFEDIDLSGMRVVVDSDESGGEVLEVSGMVDPDMEDSDADTSDPASALMDALTLTSVPEEEDEGGDTCEDDAFDMA
ncbi:hypothetical protein [Sulfitobacter sp. Ks41]|uniref:hypothetical protein n=1 Tax=Sulfitobacter sp. Ks41 TaxID=2731139 RepID=UPI0023E305DB|nr:hypothetical protein [Sulfitobacter sp. Ks41]